MTPPERCHNEKPHPTLATFQAKGRYRDRESEPEHVLVTLQ